MKFRAKIEDSNFLKSLIKLVNIFSKQHNELVLRLNDAHMCFICKELKDGASVYAKLPARYVFAEYLCAGVSEEENEIFLALDSEKFLRILRQINVYQARSIKFKLAQKDHRSLLEITIEQQANLESSELFNVSHYIPIELLSRREWTFYDELLIEDSQEVFYFPPIKHIKNVADKHKNFDQYIKFFLQANTLTLRTKNTLSEIATFYPNIEYRDPHFEPEESFLRSVELNSSRVALFLNSLDIGPTVKIETNLRDEQLINFQFVSEHIAVSFTLPHMLQ